MKTNLKKIKLAGRDFWYRSDDKVIGQRIALDKYEKYETAIMLGQVNKNSVVVDVGANIGYYTLLLAKEVKKIYAFEPDEEVFQILKKNVEENKLKNVVLINKAVGDKNEKVKIEKNKDNFGDSRISDKGELVECVKLDEVIKERVDLIKVDVQGWEPAVIEGAKNIIEKDSPILFLEYTPGEYKDKKMINFLKKIYKNIWSINDFAEVPWPIYKGIKIWGKAGYADLWMKNKMEFKDYLIMLKNVKYKKFIKGIMSLYGKNKNN